MGDDLEDLGKLLLRLAVGGLILFHGVAKLQGGIGFVSSAVQQAGLPLFLAYGVYVAEVVAPVLIIIGLLTRPAALTIVIDMLGAIYLVRRGDVTRISDAGGAWAIEVEAFFLLAALAIACLGAGRIALEKPSRWA
jgi:putative oxidoreductase